MRLTAIKYNIKLYDIVNKTQMAQSNNNSISQCIIGGPTIKNITPPTSIAITSIINPIINSSINVPPV